MKSVRTVIVSPLALIFTAAVASASGCQGCDPAGVPDGGEPGVVAPEGEPGAGPDDGGVEPGVGPGAEPDGEPGVEPGVGPGAEPDGEPGAEPDPLEQPLSDFCEGSGSVSQEGACAGDVAEETFRAALCACDGIEVGSQITVDSFDSTVGPYNEESPGESGNIGVNAQPFIPGGKVTIRGSLVVGGNSAEFGPDSLVTGNMSVRGPLTEANNTNGTIGRNAFIQGDVPSSYTIDGDLFTSPGATVGATVGGNTQEADFDIPAPCACEEEEILDIAAFAAFGAANNDNAVFGSVDGGPATPLAEDALADGQAHTLDLPCGRYYLSSVNTQNLTINVEGRAVIFVGGDFSTSGLTIDYANDEGELDLFIAGNLTVDSSTVLGDPARPANMRLYVAGDVDIQASAVIAANLYAPQANVSLSASSDVYGSLFVNRATFGGNAAVHYDSAVRNAGDACLEEEEPDVDGGTPSDDDGGPAPGDGGEPSDTDGGEVNDAGGNPGPDAGVPPTGCGNVCDNTCGATESCLVDEGVCGACRTDLDCCFPAFCNPTSGQCFFIGG